MSQSANILPFYIRASLFFIGVYAFIYILFIGQEIIVPLIYSALISILLNPLENFFIRKGAGRITSIMLAVLLAIGVTVLFCYFIFSQLSLFALSLPQFTDRLEYYILSAERFFSAKFNVSELKVHSFVLKLKTDLFENSGIFIGYTLTSLSGILIAIFLMPVYVIMISYYQPLFLEFAVKVFNKENHRAVAEVMIESKAIIQSYLSGLLIEAIIIAVMNSAGLLIIGLDYAILLGIIGAILNIIPYIGGIVGVALPMFVAMVTKDSISYPIIILVIYSIIQFIDNNFIVPRIVASRVQLNALVSIVVVIAGGAIWGVPGMFLSIPLTAIIKIIFDRIEILKPWGFLLGDSMPATPGFLRIFQKIKTSKIK